MTPRYPPEGHALTTALARLDQTADGRTVEVPCGRDVPGIAPTLYAEIGDDGEPRDARVWAGWDGLQGGGDAQPVSPSADELRALQAAARARLWGALESYAAAESGP